MTGNSFWWSMATVCREQCESKLTHYSTVVSLTFTVSSWKPVPIFQSFEKRKYRYSTYYAFRHSLFDLSRCFSACFLLERCVTPVFCRNGSNKIGPRWLLAWWMCVEGSCLTMKQLLTMKQRLPIDSSSKC